MSPPGSGCKREVFGMAGTAPARDIMILCAMAVRLRSDIRWFLEKKGRHVFVPMPVLIVLAAGFAALVFLALRRSRRDPLMGGQPKILARPRHAPAAPVAIAPLSPEDETQIRALVAANRKIEAIKLAREVTGLGLKDAKDVVEAMQ